MSERQINILVVDDEAAIRDMLTFALERTHMQVMSASDAKEALLKISEQKPDLILLDWMMPGVSGIELTRRLKKDALTKDIPIIMLTARSGEDDKVAGLDTGTDDYLIKPFSPRELIARINAVLRRTSPADDEGKIVVGNITMDTHARSITAGDTEIHMGPTEYRLLEFFISNPGRAYTRTQLLDHVWGANAYLDERTVDVHIRRLRMALESAQVDHYVRTVRGHGYRFVAQD